MGSPGNVTSPAAVTLLAVSPATLIVNVVDDAFATVKLPTIVVSLPSFVIATVSPLFNKFTPISLVIDSVVTLLLLMFPVVLFNKFKPTSLLYCHLQQYRKSRNYKHGMLDIKHQVF